MPPYNWTAKKQPPKATQRLTQQQLENLTPLDIKTLTLELIIILLSSIRFVAFSNRERICQEAIKNLKSLLHELRKDQLKETTEETKIGLWTALGRRLLPPFIQEALVRLLQEQHER